MELDRGRNPRYDFPPERSFKPLPEVREQFGLGGEGPCLGLGWVKYPKTYAFGNRNSRQRQDEEPRPPPNQD